VIRFGAGGGIDDTYERHGAQALRIIRTAASFSIMTNHHDEDDDG